MAASKDNSNSHWLFSPLGSDSIISLPRKIPNLKLGILRGELDRCELEPNQARTDTNVEDS